MSLEARDDFTRHVPRAAGADRALSFGREANSRGASPFILRVRRRGAGAVLAVLLSAGGANAAKVACGDSYTCAIRDDGNVWCWGSNQGGQLGMGSTGGSSPNPVEVDLGSGRTAKAICAGYSHNCVILDDDTIQVLGLWQ
jgi:alpha-tubulin suppressor-like RCC1 family protein